MVAPSSWKRSIARRDFLDHDRGQPERRFVEQQKHGLSHHRPSECQHLLLAAAERSASLAAAFGEAGKQSVDALARLLLIGAGPGRVSANPKILLNRQSRKYPPAFRHVNDAAFDAVVPVQVQ